ncbi:MAG: hypothetical protein Q7T44_08410, partial [Parvibaculum sp.]|nr:hypothetical protein [Parvibaculum sp.]
MSLANFSLKKFHEILLWVSFTLPVTVAKLLRRDANSFRFIDLPFCADWFNSVSFKPIEFDG